MAEVTGAGFLPQGRSSCRIGGEIHRVGGCEKKLFRGADPV